VVAPAGTVTTTLVSLQLVAAASVPLRTAALAPCAAPKLVPPIVTASPTRPVEGVNDVIDGGGMTLNVTPLLETPLTVTTRGPLVAPAGTDAEMLVFVQFVAAAVMPLNLTALLPCVVPKFAPAIVTGSFA
jgi:hypothetical protein